MEAISVHDVHIKYAVVQGISVKALFHSKASVKKKFHAVKGVSFSVEEGSVTGIIGKNGSGKSTLLRAIAGVFSPDEGKIDVHGNHVSLLALGVGFQKDLSGRDNIYLSGLLMGLSLSEIDDSFDEIVRFSELEEFIDNPVSTYSSGMYSKLSFAIACIMKPDILLIDEVLSVGDVAFRKKSAAKLKELICDKSVTVVMVSHNSNMIRELCDQVVWLNDGVLIQVGPADEVVSKYEEFMANKK